jgi:predicted lipoprotein with Yx(FWY)xxD motif
MTHSRYIRLLASAAAVPLAALTLAGCGSSNASGSTAPPRTASGQPATIGVASSSLGNILVNSQGRTVYLFTKDMASKSTCFGPCASIWMPLRASGKPTVAGGASASRAGTIARSDGKPQVTYNGHPLYLFQEDQKPGDTNGQDLTAFGGSWHALSQAGHQLSSQASSSVGGHVY